MAAKLPPDDATVTSTGADETVGLRPITGSLAHAQLATEIGRSLQAQYRNALNEPLPEALVALVRQLMEQDKASSPSGQR
jgi:Anti-sigma factor NepR